MSNDVAIKITADSSQLSKEFKRAIADAKGAASQIQGAFSKVGGALGAVGLGVGLGEIFSKIKEQTTEAERSVNQLNQVLKLTGQSAGLTGKQIEELGKDVEKSSIFDDDQIRDAATALLRFRTIQGDTFREVLKLAPDAASVLGVSLPDAAEKLGHAFQEPERGLRAFKAVGVQVSEAQIDLATRLKETGDIAGAQQVVFDALRKSLGGAGEADTQGLYGTSKRLERALGDLGKAAGKKIFSDNGKVVGDFTTLLGSLRDRVNETDISFAKLLSEPFGLLKFGSDVLRSALSGFRSPVVEAPKGRGPNDAVGGKINTDAADQADAQRAAEAQKREQEADAEYAKQQARIKALAARSSAAASAELEQQRNFLRLRSEANEFAYKQDTKAAADYYSTVKQLAIDDAKAEQDAIAKQIEAKAKAANALSTNQQEREGLNAEIHSLAEQHGNVRTKLEIALLKIQQDQTAELRKQNDAYDDIHTKLIEVTGSARDAAAASFDQSNRETLRKISAEETSSDPAARARAEAARAALAQIKAQTLLQVDLNHAQKDFDNTLEDVSILQARINLLQESGSITELDAYAKRATLAKENIGRLQAQADAYEALALKEPLGSDARADALRQVQRLRLEIDQLAASADALENKFRDIFVSGISDGLTELITRTKTVSQAFKDMETQIVNSITKIATQNIAESIFGKAGAGGGVPALFASLFGGGGPQQLSGPTDGGGIIDLFKGLFGFAAGGPVAANDPIIVGEKGKEIFVPKTAGTIIPNNKIGGGVTIVQHINVLPGASRTTADQAAMRSGIAAQRALARNG